MKPTKSIYKIVSLSCCAMALGMVMAGCRFGKDDKVVARFESGTITKGLIQNKLQALPPQIREAVVKQKEDFVQQLVDEKLLFKEALKRGMDQDKEVKDLIAAAREKILIAKLIQTEVDSKISFEADEALKFYESHPDEFMSPLILRASHILLASKEDAERVRLELETGADFEKMAREKSLHASGERGGDVGFFQKGQFLPEFEKAALALKVGEVSGVVQTQFGFHVIKLTDRIEPKRRDFESIRVPLERQLALGKKRKLLDEFVNVLRKGVNVKINKEALDGITA